METKKENLEETNSYSSENDESTKLLNTQNQDNQNEKNKTPSYKIEDITINMDKYPPKFQKEALKFDKINLDPSVDEKISAELNDITSRLSEIASKSLYKWKSVPVAFPPSISSFDSSAGSNNKHLQDSELFILPTFDELDEIATDPATGNTKKLNKKQLDSIKEKGRFEVESKYFPGKNHEWVLAKWIQKGFKNTNEAFFKDISNALFLLIIVAKRRFCSNFFSIWEGLKSIKKGFRNLFDILFGLREMKTVDYDRQLEEDWETFLVSDLDIDPNDKEKFETLCENIRIALADSKYVRQQWNIPYVYRTSSNILIDLRLYDSNLTKKIEPVLRNILELTQNEKLLIDDLRNKTISIFKNESLENDEIIKRTKKILFKEYLKIINDKLLNSSDLENISPGVGKLLVDQSKSVIIMQNVCEEFQQELDEHLKNYELMLKNKYKVRSYIVDWLDDCLEREKTKFLKSKSYSMHIKSIEKCKEEKLDQTAYFIEREMKFLKEHREGLIKKYEKVKEPVRNFVFYRRIWFPKNYIINKNFNSNNQVYYTMKTYSEYKNNTKYPFWRWKNFFIRTWVNLCNAFFIFGIVIPFCSPVSFRALFSIKPFVPGKKVNQYTGKLEPSGKPIQTFISRLLAIWDHVSSSRRKFEATPDKGLIGKSVQRVFNKFWNYIIKGLLGSVGLTLIYPTICLTFSIGSLVLFVLSPIWYPLLSLIQHIGFTLIFDWDYPYQRGAAKIFRLIRIPIIDFFLCGMIQPIAALGTSTILCPIGSLLVTKYALFTTVFRRIWDNLIFHVILKHQAKTPSRDTFLCRRVAGPGLASNFFYQAKIEQILAALEMHLDRKIINSYLENVKQKLNEPLNIYSKLLNPVFENYSYSINSNFGPYGELSRNVQSQIDKYVNAANKLRAITRGANYSSIRLTEKDLQILLSEGTKMVKKHYQESILVYQNKSIEKFFEEEATEINDWNSIAGSELEEIFGAGILTPLEDTDCIFNLKVDHLNLEKYSSMIANAKLRDDLDLVHTNYNPRSDKIKIDRPVVFSLIDDANQKFRTWSGDDPRGHMSIITQIPESPEITAVIVHNVKNDQNKIDYKNFISISSAIKRKNV